jgi:hypothetical protein
MLLIMYSFDKRRHLIPSLLTSFYFTELGENGADKRLGNTLFSYQMINFEQYISADVLFPITVSAVTFLYRLFPL